VLRLDCTSISHRSSRWKWKRRLGICRHVEFTYALLIYH